jgi:chemotaxis protein methyltransferase CheR
MPLSGELHVSSSVFQVSAGPALRPLNQKEFQQIKELVYDRFGLDLRAGKEDLVSARLSKRIRELRLSSFSEYVNYVLSDADGAALAEMVDLLTTNFTSFFREQAHFDFLAKRLPELSKKRARIRIWSAACSSGEEPYSIAMLGSESLGLGNVEILGTDISTRILARAKAGVYSADRLEGIPQDVFRKYFLRGQGASNGLYRVKPVLANQITFQRLNLLDTYAHESPFSMIWCRNVMIYFDKPTQERVVNRLAQHLEPGGHLLIGHSEALNGIQHPLQYIQPAVYRKRETK